MSCHSSATGIDLFQLIFFRTSGFLHQPVFFVSLPLSRHFVSPFLSFLLYFWVFTMELRHVSAISMNSWLPCNSPRLSSLQRLGCCYHGTGFDIKLLYGFPDSWINHPRLSKLQHLSLPLQKRHPFSAARVQREVILSFVPVEKARRLSALDLCKVTSDEAGEATSGESILLDQQSLEEELQIAIKEENYAKAARIRDSLRVFHEDSKASVLATNARFYNAFRNGDLAAMQFLWVKGENACCVHPGARGISGYDLVMRSWEYVWVDYEFPLEIELKDVEVHVRGDVGTVTCVELVKTKGSGWGRQFATNVFERVDGQWFICVHHASPIDL